jgi:glycosyltransferase involved in cell wall biosynthesis
MSKTPTQTALFLAPDAVQMGGARLMGRQSAGNGFLRAFVQATDASRDLLLVHQRGEQEKILVEEVAKAGWKKGIRHFDAHQPGSWEAFDVMHYPAPPSSQLAWQRARGGATQYAFSGVTHTISSSGVMQQLADYMTAPVASWDALVCTSNSVLRAVERIWDSQREHLQRRLGVKDMQPELPMTPVIPLGIHCDDFTPDAAERLAGRVQWDVQPDEILVLFVGRLCLHAKANPLPMYLACARAAQRSGKRLRFLECGWFANDSTRKVYEEAARLAGIRVTQVDGRIAGVTRRAYASADIFLSLSDNIQETFGLTPVEAMAAGLPVVVSDWDGYRETVRDGIDGFLVPATQPADPECAQDVVRGYEDGRFDYDRYVAYSHMMVSVDVEACAASLAQLMGDAGLRQRMGAAGRERARTVYDWSVVFARYRQLWDEQRDLLHAARARMATENPPSMQPQVNPAYLNPLVLFSHYPAFAITPETRLLANTDSNASAAGWPQASALRQLGMWGFSGSWLGEGAFMQTAVDLLVEAADAGMGLREWSVQLAIPVARAIRTATWLHKVGAIRIDLATAARIAAAAEDRSQ